MYSFKGSGRHIVQEREKKWNDVGGSNGIKSTMNIKKITLVKVRTQEWRKPIGIYKKRIIKYYILFIALKKFERAWIWDGNEHF